MIPIELQNYHTSACAEARRIYVDGMAPEPLAKEWRQLNRVVRKDILRTLVATDYLRDIFGCITKNGQHILVLRHLFAPPISQDQLKLISPLYPKQCEKKGTRVRASAAQEFVSIFNERRDRTLTAWLDTNRLPNRAQVKKLVNTIAPMIASQIFNTVRRNRLSDEQEAQVERILRDIGWSKEISTVVNLPSDILPKTYMRKTKCRSSATATKEVDIACGVRTDLILAMECKVSNDSTNSVKRVSEVMDKVKSWNGAWGNFIQTAAMLKGVIAYKEIVRMLDSNVVVFWSHDMDPFVRWLNDNS